MTFAQEQRSSVSAAATSAWTAAILPGTLCSQLGTQCGLGRRLRSLFSWPHPLAKPSEEPFVYEIKRNSDPNRRRQYREQLLASDGNEQTTHSLYIHFIGDPCAAEVQSCCTTSFIQLMKMVYLIPRLAACTASLGPYYIPSRPSHWFPSLYRPLCILYTGDKRLSFKSIALLLSGRSSHWYSPKSNLRGQGVGSTNHFSGNNPSNLKYSWGLYGNLSGDTNNYT